MEIRNVINVFLIFVFRNQNLTEISLKSLLGILRGIYSLFKGSRRLGHP